jgi:hypothetical protein
MSCKACEIEKPAEGADLCPKCDKLIKAELVKLDKKYYTRCALMMSDGADKIPSFKEYVKSHAGLYSPMTVDLALEKDALEEKKRKEKKQKRKKRNNKSSAHAPAFS